MGETLRTSEFAVAAKRAGTDEGRAGAVTVRSLVGGLAVVMWIGPRIIRLAYEMVCVLVAWPFL